MFSVAVDDGRRLAAIERGQRLEFLFDYIRRRARRRFFRSLRHVRRLGVFACARAAASCASLAENLSGCIIDCQHLIEAV